VPVLILGIYCKLGKSKMNILVSGASGLIGSALVESLIADKHNVKRLVRSKDYDSKTAIFWDPAAGIIKTDRFESFDLVIHLAGENIAGKNPVQGRWTKARKEQILESRMKGTKLLSDALAKLQNPPRLLISASAIGYYGDRGEEKLNEESSNGSGFLAKVCLEWEKATSEAIKKGIRVVNARFGVVLSKKGGALASMLLPFKMGLGGILGTGKQYMSWISLEDAVGAIKHIIENDSIKGPVNIVSPNPVTNSDYTKILGHKLGRPTVIPMPAGMVNLLFGEMGNELLLYSQKVVPQKLLSTNYNFKLPQLSNALEKIL
jgi:uncharacterized protein (TIGR01777 family)